MYSSICFLTLPFYHGKVFRFCTADSSYILYGSSNCTKAAITKSFNDNGNIECNILEKGNINEFDNFFETFNIVDEPLKCEPIKYNSEYSSNYIFRYAILGADIKLYFDFHKENDFKILCKGKELKHSINNHIIEATIPTEDIIPDTDIFDVEFVYEDKTDIIKCWCIVKDVLAFNRNKEVTENIYRIDFDNNEDKYLEDKMTILRETSLTHDEVQNEIDIINSVNENSSETAEDEIEDGIISYVIPPADILKKYNKFKRLNTIRNGYIKSYYENAIHGITSAHNQSNASTPSKSVFRQPTNDEKRFQRFVKSRIKAITDSYYSTLYGYDHYLSSILVFIDIFTKYTIEEKVEDMFDNEFIIASKILMLDRLLNKAYDENSKISELSAVSTIVLTLQTILS